MNIIEIQDLTKFYTVPGGFLKKAKTHMGIQDVSFQVAEGEIFGFIGPNGAGKSTTIRTLLSLIYPTKGSAKIFGKDTVQFSHEILKDIGYLPSEVFCYDDMKIGELLNYSASFYKKDCTANIKKYSELLELNLDRKFDELSFGNKKKVGIVSALIHDPKLLILDEPTSGLDPLMQKVFFEILKERHEQGTTIFFSSHILSEVQKLCDRVAIIRGGKIVKIETVDGLRNTNYKKVLLETKEPVAFESLGLTGVTDQKQENGGTSFLYNGDLSLLLQKIAAVPINNILIEDPSLEEIFMRYYE